MKVLVLIVIPMPQLEEHSLHCDQGVVRQTPVPSPSLSCVEATLARLSPSSSLSPLKKEQKNHFNPSSFSKILTRILVHRPRTFLSKRAVYRTELVQLGLDYDTVDFSYEYLCHKSHYKGSTDCNALSHIQLKCLYGHYLINNLKKKILTSHIIFSIF